MKSKKILIIIILIALALITGGIIGTIPLSTTPKEEIKEQREYKTVKQETEAMNPLSSTDGGFSTTAKASGFETTKCEENLCVATNKGYTNSDNVDTVTYNYENNEISTISTMLYFHKNDYKVKNVVTQLNTVVGNYTKYILEESFVSDAMKSLETSKDVSIKTKKVDNYTIELTTMPVDNSDFYMVKYWLVPTTIYSQYKGI